MAGSWADAQGVLAGDQLVAVNDRPTASLTQEDIGVALRARPLRLSLARSLAAAPAPTRLEVEADTEERLGFKPGGQVPHVYVEKLFPNGWAVTGRWRL